jgi:hypothetical protein
MDILSYNIWLQLGDDVSVQGTKNCRPSPSVIGHGVILHFETNSLLYQPMNL